MRYSSRFVAIALVMTAALPLSADQSQIVNHVTQTVRAYHQGATDNGDVLRVVYFTPSDVEPQADYEARLGRIMLDMQAFYRDEMKRLGFGGAVFPLEMKDGKLKVHVVRGNDDHTQYKHESGQKTVREIRAVLGDTIDLDHEHVLIFHGMCTKRDDGSYFFYAPYYGDARSNHVRGLCHAADCEMLDPELLGVTDRRVKYMEHYGNYNQTLGDFNTKYLGGIAHEMGHGLGLPHNSQTPREKRELGTALMGAGNHTYRNEKRGGKGSFLTLATAVRLASHPLFTHSDTGRADPVSCELKDLRFTNDGVTLKVTGRVDASPSAYAVIAYNDPDGRSDYDARTDVAVVKDGAFELSTPCWKSGHHDWRLTVCHLNGATSTFRFKFNANDKREPDAGYLSAQWLRRGPEKAMRNGNKQEAVKLANELLERDDLPQLVQQQMRHLVWLVTNSWEPISPADAKGDTVHVSDLEWKSAKVGWGEPVTDRYHFDRRNQNPVFLEIDKTFYRKGLYAHAPSRYVFDLGKSYKRLTAVGGLQDGHAEPGTAVFVVKADGKELFRSDVLKGRRTCKIDVPVEGIDQLELIVETGKQGNAFCWSIWGAPTLHR